MDRALVKSWYEQYKQDIFRYAFFLVKDAHLAEDILHDTFVKLLSGRYAVDPEKIRPWLYRVARNLSYDQLRKRKFEAEEAEPAYATGNPYAYIELLAHLPQRDQEIVSLKIIGGLTHREIGAVLGITAAAAQKRYERAIATLRDEEDVYGTKTV